MFKSNVHFIHICVKKCDIFCGFNVMQLNKCKYTHSSSLFKVCLIRIHMKCEHNKELAMYAGFMLSENVDSILHSPSTPMNLMDEAEDQ